MLFSTLPLDPYDDEEPEGSGRHTTAIIIGMVAAFLIVVPLVFLLIFSGTGGGDETATPRPGNRIQMVFDYPQDGDDVILGEEIEVSVTIDDPVGVDTVELRVGGRVVQQLGGEEMAADNPPQFIFLWTPDRVGARRLEAIETNLDGERSDPIAVTVNVIREGGETETPSATETETPTPTPTAREGALPGVANSDASLFEDPDASSSLIGQLTTDDEVEVVGRTDESDWLEIFYPPGEDTTAWVATEFVDVDGDVEELPVTFEKKLREGALAGTATGNGNVYEEPDSESSLIGSLTDGDELEVVGRTEESDWLEIIFPPGGDATGWVEADFVTVEGDVTELPVTGETAAAVDLVPTGLSVQPPSNDVVLEITNQGDDTFDGASISVDIAGLTIAVAVPELGPDETADLPLGNLHVYTTAEYTVEIDTTDAVKEKDEDNNTLSEQLAPEALADLVLDDIRLIGSDNHVVLRIQNAGDANLVDATIAITLNGPIRQFGKVTREISIEPGATITIEISEVALDREVELTVTLDVDAAVDETDEGNNTLAKVVRP